VTQSELPFDAASEQHGYERWQEERRAAKATLAQRLGLPLGRQVEVWLRGEVRLRGRLDLAEKRLFVPEGDDGNLQLAVGRATFRIAEIESCVRMD